MDGAKDEGAKGISRADLPSCAEMADHHRRISREPNTREVVLTFHQDDCVPIASADPIWELKTRSANWRGRSYKKIVYLEIARRFCAAWKNLQLQLVLYSRGANLTDKNVKQWRNISQLMNSQDLYVS